MKSLKKKVEEPKKDFLDSDLLKKKLEDLRIEELRVQQDICTTKKEIFLIEQKLPFEEGSDIMFEVPAGRTKKITKCKLELEYDVYTWRYYARPYTSDGSLSSRHFIVYKNDYDKVKPVEE